MINLSYNLSAELRQSLGQIQFYRRQVLLAPLAPKQELKLRWEANLNRIYHTLQLTDNRLPKRELARLLSRPSPRRKLKTAEKAVINYKQALDYLAQEWLVTPKNVTLNTIMALHRLGLSPRPFRIPQKPLKQLLAYLQAQPENPIIQAGTALVRLPHFAQNQRLAHLLAYLFLYKSGFDCRGMLVLEEYFAADRPAFSHAADFALKANNLTFWLEYFAQATAFQLKVATSRLKAPPTKSTLPASFWKLNKRQQAILVFLSRPNTTITNRQVQKFFKVSQITASRDLAKLKSLNLAFSYGQGRSTTYSKV